MNIQTLIIVALVIVIVILLATRNRGATQDFTQVVLPSQSRNGTVVVPTEAQNGYFDLRLEAAGSRKIEVIKQIRTFTSLGLKEAKDLMEAAPVNIVSGVNFADAEKIRLALVEAGATVTVLPQGK